jgi:hypothetical protein
MPKRRQEPEHEQNPGYPSSAKRHQSSSPSGGQFKRPNFPLSSPPPSNTNVLLTSPSQTTTGIQPPTPRTATRYGISGEDSKDILRRIDSFPALINIVQKMVDLLRGGNCADSDFGKLLLQAVKEVAVSYTILVVLYSFIYRILF